MISAMNTMRLFGTNIMYTVACGCVCALLALVLSWIVGFMFFNEAFVFRVSGGGIDTEKLMDYDRMRYGLVWLGAGTGVIIAQSVFLVRHLVGQKPDNNPI